MSQVEHLPTDQSSLESLRSEMFASFKYRLCTAVSHAFIGVHHEEYFRSETFKSWRNSFMNSRYGGTLSLGRMTDFALPVLNYLQHRVRNESSEFNDGYGFFVNKFFPALLTLDFGRFEKAFGVSVEESRTLFLRDPAGVSLARTVAGSVDRARSGSSHIMKEGFGYYMDGLVKAPMDFSFIMEGMIELNEVASEQL